LRRRIRYLIELPEHQPIRMTRRSSTMLGMFSAAVMLFLLLLCVRIVPASTIPPAAERLPELSSSKREQLQQNSGAVVSEWSRLHMAVFSGTDQEIQMLLANRADPNVRTAQGWTPLHFASCLNRTEVVRMLIDAGAGVDAPNNEGETPLLSALGFHPPLPTNVLPAESAAHELLQRNASVNLADKAGITPLHAAVLRGHVSLARDLLNRGAHVDAPDTRGRTPLHLACDRADAAMIKLLVDNKANCRLTDQDGRSTLQHLALVRAQRNPADIVRKAAVILRGGGAVPDLCSAIVLGDAQTVQSILQQDSTLVNKVPAVTVQDWRPIHWAVDSNQLSICGLLLGSPYNADPNVRATDGCTPLHRAIQIGDGPQILQALVNAGANASAADKRGLTPLHLAASNRKIDILRSLLAAKADPNAVELEYGRTPLHFAVMWADKRQPAPVAAGITALIASRANVNAADSTGRTALHYACALGRIELVEALLAAPDIEVNVIDFSGATPLSLATSSASADSQLVQLLLDHGATPKQGAPAGN
jgi:ankyrin repeat protein